MTPNHDTILLSSLIFFLSFKLLCIEISVQKSAIIYLCFDLICLIYGENGILKPEQFDSPADIFSSLFSSWHNLCKQSGRQTIPIFVLYNMRIYCDEKPMIYYVMVGLVLF